MTLLAASSLIALGAAAQKVVQSNNSMFPAPDPSNFTAAKPTVDEVNAFLKASWGYDENRVWQVQAILKTPVPGVSKVIVALGDKSGNAAASLVNLAQTLARAGRGDEAGPYLDQAETLARDLKDAEIGAQALGARGEVALYRGDPAAAAPLFQRAMALAAQAGGRDVIVAAKLDLARLALAQGRAADAVARLKPLVGDGVTADRNLASQCAVYLAEALIATREYAKAHQFLQAAAAPAEKSGMRLRLARIYYLQGTASRLSGNSGDAWNEYRQAAALLNSVRSEPGDENILRRADLKAAFDDCNRWVGATGVKP